MPEQSPATIGIDHVGLTVRDLETTRRFFCECLGWNVVGGNPAYPALFVSDGQDLVTLWQVEAPDHTTPFNRRRNLGLHHLALKVADRPSLDTIFARVAAWPGVAVEFTPQPLGKGPRIHCMINEPGGLRIEFACTP
jgi:catechol 2,3-dioxygenase-like lactoylglutathione lyase family enzyme